MEKIRRGRWGEKGGSGERVWKRWFQGIEELEIKEPALGGRRRQEECYSPWTLNLGRFFFFFLESSIVDSYRSLEF